MTVVTRAPMTATVVTEYGPTWGGQRQMWAARSVDGEWTYTRSEAVGTPWTVVHEPTGRWTKVGSLVEGRRLTARHDVQQFLQDPLVPS